MWRRHAGSIYSYAVRRVGRDAAEDVVADTFVVAWRHRDRRPQRPLPWLYGVARRVIATRRRAERRRALLVRRVAGGATGVADPATGSVEAEDALARLSRGDREVLLLSAWEGLAADEAAVMLGISPSAYRKRLSRARRRLETITGGEAA